MTQPSAEIIRLREYRRHWREKYPEKSLLRLAQKRAVSRGTEFNLTLEDIVIPEICPVLGIPLIQGSRQLKDQSPTVDEFIPGKGYVKGNIVIISWRANRLKSDATLSEMQRVLKYYETPRGNLKETWLRHCWRLSKEAADLYSGARKILTNQTLTFTSLDDSLQLIDAGYTKSKQTMLTGHYLHNESRDVAIQLWEKRRGQAKYGSVSFTTFAHFVKGGSIDAKRSRRASVFGPCLQSVVITLLDKKRYSIDIFWRTTEFFKKLPADLCFIRDVLLAPFDFKSLSMHQFNCHFANVTMHPMYAVTIFPLSEDTIALLDDLKEVDPFFWKWSVKWSARYLCSEHSRGILKFSQALRVRKDVMSRLSPAMVKRLQKYLRTHHPRFRSDYEDPDDDE